MSATRLSSHPHSLLVGTAPPDNTDSNAPAWLWYDTCQVSSSKATWIAWLHILATKFPLEDGGGGGRNAAVN